MPLPIGPDERRKLSFTMKEILIWAYRWLGPPLQEQAGQKAE